MSMYGKTHQTILEAFPSHIRFLSRDENGELWATKEKPTIKDHQYLEFAPSEDFARDVQSLSIYNHIFREVSNLAILEIL